MFPFWFSDLRSVCVARRRRRPLRLYSDIGVDSTGRFLLNRAARLDAPPKGRLRASLPAACPRGLHRRSIFVVIARDITDNVAIDSDQRVVSAMARTAPPSV